MAIVEHGLLVDADVARSHAKYLREAGYAGVHVVHNRKGYLIRSYGMERSGIRRRTLIDVSPKNVPWIETIDAEVG